MTELDHPKKLIEMGNIEGAISELKRIVLRDRTNVKAWLLLGLNLQDRSQAKYCYEQVLKNEPVNKVAQHNLGLLIQLEEEANSSQRIANDLESELNQTINNIRSSYKVSSAPSHKFDAGPQINSIKGQPGYGNIRKEISDKIADLEIKRKSSIGLGISVIIFCLFGFFSGDFLDDSDSTPLICCSSTALITILYLFGSAFMLGDEIKKLKPELELPDHVLKEDASIKFSQLYPLASEFIGKSIVPCKVCGKDVSKNASSCPYCGENIPGLYLKCPKCNSSNIVIGQKGFSLGKAAAGAVLFGPMGLLGGMIGRSDIEFGCLGCKHRWTLPPEHMKRLLS